MAIYSRIAAAIAASLIFAGCTAVGSHTKAKPDGQTAAAENPSCLTQTGSRISVKGECRGTGRSYTNDDISGTGATTAGGALRLLDPSIIVHQ
jgi:hypothetical protein